jgi:hypothetical protein
MYMPPAAEDRVANGSVGSTFLALMRTAWGAWLTALQTAGTQLVVASYVHTEANDVDLLNVEALVATQRRRQDQLR